MSEIKVSVDGIEYEPTGKCCVEGNDIVIRYGMHQVIFKPKEKDIPKDFQILSYQIDNSQPTPISSYTENIYSVKRLSDGEVFSIDTVTDKGEIYAFEIAGWEMIAKFKNNYGFCNINFLSVAKPKVPLFTTVNFESIYEGDEYYYSPKVTLAWINKAVKGHPQPPESFYYFKTQEEAEQYQLDNKSILVNYNEFMEGIDMQLSNRLTNSIRDIFKSKINLTK